MQDNGIRCLVLIQKNKWKKIPLCHKSLRMCEYRVYLVFNTWNRRCYTRQPLGWTLGSTPQHPQTPLLSPWITPRKYKQHHRLSPLLWHPQAPPPAALLSPSPASQVTGVSESRIPWLPSYFSENAAAITWYCQSFINRTTLKYLIRQEGHKVFC